VYPGGTWISSNTSVATISAATGAITGAAAGTAAIIVTTTAGCSGIVNYFSVYPNPYPIPGIFHICSGATVTLADGTTGGYWSSSNSIATVNPVSGAVTGVSGGTDTISYTAAGGCSATTVVTVNTLPSSIGGATSVCTAGTATLTDATSSGTWSSSNTGIATVSSAGSIGGIVAGTTTIQYTISSGCTASTEVTVNSLPYVYTINGGGDYCAGGTGRYIGLSGSQTGVSYQLYSGGAAVGSPVTGTGYPLSLGIYTTGTYTAIATNTATLCTCTMTGSAIVATYPSPAVYTLSTGGSYCSGGTGIHITLSGSDLGINYQLFIPGGPTPPAAIPGIGSVLDFGLRTEGTYKAIASNAVTGCTDTMAGSPTVTATPLPTVFTLSVGGSYCSGDSGAYISLNGSTSSVTYKLYNGTMAVGPTLAGTGLPLDFGRFPAGIYTAVASSSSCSDPMANSDTVTALPLPTRYAVTGGGTICPGSTGADISLNSSNVGITYQLYSGGPIETPIAGTGSAIYFGPIAGAGTYIVIASNTSTGCTDTMSGAGTISLYPLPVISGPTALCIGGTIIETAPSFTGGTWSSSNIAVATVGISTGHVTSVSAGTTTIYYTSTVGCAGTITVTVMPTPPPIGGIRSVCLGSTTSLTPTGGGIWTSSNTSIISVSSLGVISGISLGTATIYYSFGFGCAVSAVATVNPLPTVYTLSGGGSYCSGGSGVDIALSNTDAGTTYQLFSGSTTLGSMVAGTGSSHDFGMYTYTGIYSVVATNAGGCSANMAGTPSITINTLPPIHNITGGGSFCADGTGVHTGLDGSDTGISYKLYDGSALAATILGTGFTLDFGLITTAGIYSVVATTTHSCINDMTGFDTVTVLPSPTAYSVVGGGSYCAGSSGANVSLSSSDAGTSYQLYHGTVPVGPPISGIGTALDFGAQTVIGAYTILATNIATGCIAQMIDSASITVTSLPAIYTVTGGGSYCVGDSGVAIGLSASHSGVNYQLYNGSTPAGSTFAGTGSSLDFGLQTASGNYTVVASNVASTGCTDTMAGSRSVVVNSLPAAHSVTGGGTRCASGAGISVLLDGSAAAINYTLYDGITSVSTLAGTGGPLDFGLETTAGTYTVIATNIGTSCTNNMTDSAMITVIPSVVPSITIAATPGDTVCAGASVTFTETSVNGGTMPTYSWILNGTPVSPDSNFTYSPGNGDVVYAVMTSSAECASPITASSTNVIMDVLALPAISGGTIICAGSHITLSDTTGGIWTSSNPAVATIATIGASTGVVSGVGPGTATLTYTLDTACSVATTFTVLSLPVISASASSVSCGGVYTLSGSGGLSYTWSPSTGISCTSCSTTDVVPIATTTYYVTGTDAEGCSDSAAVSVDGNRISGYISPALTGSLQVWLIQFNASDSSLIALDSTTTCVSGGLPYYEFDDKAPGSYLVKAFLTGGTPGASGYIPTYGSSSPHWDSATSIMHGGDADTLHINMIYGTIPTGSGFVGGLISSGAGRATLTDVPAQGMLVYLIDAGTNQVLTYNYTDVNGAYSFSNLANGNYIIYPEDYDYRTTPSPAISLAGAADSITGVNFKQHTTARTITPTTVPVGTSILLSSKSEIQVFPNPASGNLNIQWNKQQPGSSELIITDVIGRKVYEAAVNMTSSSGQLPLDISSLRNGIYLISVKTEKTEYNGKLIVQ